MDVALLFARVALAAVLAAAGIGKLRDRAEAREAIIAFGVPGALAPALAVVVPLAELTIAVLLIPVATAAWAAVAALLLLAVFTAAIVLNLSRGRAPACNCFGVASRAPIGPRTLVRNGVLMALAGFVAVAGWNDAGDGVLEWFSKPVDARDGRDTPRRRVRRVGRPDRVALAVVPGVRRRRRRLRRRAGRARRRRHGAGVRGGGPRREHRRARSRSAGPACPRCSCSPTRAAARASRCFPTSRRWQRELAGDLTVVVVASGDAGDVRAETECARPGRRRGPARACRCPTRTASGGRRPRSWSAPTAGSPSRKRKGRRRSTS